MRTFSTKQRQVISLAMVESASEQIDLQIKQHKMEAKSRHNGKDMRAFHMMMAAALKVYGRDLAKFSAVGLRRKLADAGWIENAVKKTLT